MTTTKFGIDCATKITDSVAKALVKENVAFVCRYMVPSTMASKRLLSSEVTILKNNNLSILSVYESTANRAKEGANAGASDGKAALAEAKTLGMPTSGCIYFAVDYDAPSSDMDTIAKYLTAAKAQISNYKIGVYGSYSVIEAIYAKGICDCFWQTYAWSNSKTSTHANVYQYKNDQTLGGISVDYNKSYGNEGFWGSNITENTWDVILDSVATQSTNWKTAVNLAVSSATSVGLSSLVIFKYLPELIVKIDNLTYSSSLTWDKIIDKVSISKSSEWKIAINAAVGAAKADGDLGTLEIFKYLPELIVKIYEKNK